MAKQAKLPQGMVKRGDVYHADFVAKGVRVCKRLSTDLGTAKEQLNALRVRADRAEYGLMDNNVLLSEIREQWLRHCRQTLRPASVERYETNLDNIFNGLGVLRVSQITVDGVLTFRQNRLAAGRTPNTINKDVGALSTMLRWAKEHKIVGSNPLDSLKPLPDSSPKEARALTDDEVGRLLQSSPLPWRDIWYAFLVTGVRLGELASLTWRDVDWATGELVVRAHKAKGKRERRLRIDADLFKIIERQHAGRAARKPGIGRSPKLTAQIQARFTRDHVFVTSQNTPINHRSGAYAAFLRCCSKAGIPVKTYEGTKVVEHVDVHSLRRTFATNLIVNGADPKTVQESLGHRTLDMTMRIYTKINAQTKAQAITKLSYGSGALAPQEIVQYPVKEAVAETISRRNHASNQADSQQSPQVLAAQG